MSSVILSYTLDTYLQYYVTSLSLLSHRESIAVLSGNRLHPMLW